MKKFSEEYKDATLEFQLALKYLYKVMRKKGIYHEYKRHALPPQPKRYTEEFLGRHRRFPVARKMRFSKGKETMLFCPTKRIDYSRFLFFRVHSAAYRILLDTYSGQGEISLGEIMDEIPQEYFKNEYKGEKLPIKDRTLYLWSGLAFTLFFCIFSTYLCYLIFPESLTLFLKTMMAINLFGFSIVGTVTCGSILFDKNENV
jgi:hypothetical protein